MNKWINWFEIPATDFDRAVAFYNTIFGIELHSMDMAGTKMGMFPTDENSGGGAIVQGEGQTPAMDGTLVYLNGGDDLNGVLDKVEEAGGSIFVPKTNIGEGMGHFAIFRDTEGNKVALHSMN